MTHIHACIFLLLIFWSTPCFIGKTLPATVATVKCSSDCNNCGHSYNYLTFNGRSHFISLHNALKLKRLFSVRKAIFRNPFLLCCISFCLLGKILLVSRILMAFARRLRLGKMDFQRPVRAAKTFLAHTMSRKHFLLTEWLLLIPHDFAFCLFFPKRKAFAGIHRNIELQQASYHMAPRALS